MTTITSPAPTRVSATRGYRFELVKQLAQWRIRVLIGLCWIGPALTVIVVSGQGTLPSDTLFGREMHATGWAGALVVLSFAGSWFFPLLTSVVAGDVFSAEDRLGTWRHLLVAVRSPRRIFFGKVLASLTVLLVCLPGLAVSGMVGGLVVGSRPLTGLDGHSLSPADAAGKLLLAWVCVLAPILAFAAIGLLASIIFGRSPIGLLLPAFGGLGMQLASQVLPMPVAVRLALPSFAFLSWNGLFTSPPILGPLLTGIAVSLAWALAATVLAYVLFMRRDFTTVANDGSIRRAITFGILPLLGVWALSAGVVAAATGATGSGIDASKLQRSLATSFAHLYRLQGQELYHMNVTEAQLRASATCIKGGGLVAQNSAGNDWRCTVLWHFPGVNTATGAAIYQLDVDANGRYIADGDGPNEVNGYFVVHASYGDAPNPLWQFDGLVDLLSHHIEGIDPDMQVKRHRRSDGKPPLLRRLGDLRVRTIAAGATAVALIFTGTGLAYASTNGFGTDQVGQTVRQGIVVSDDQIINPIGDRLLTQFGKFMGSTVSPNGQFLAATSTDKGVSLQIFDLKAWKLIWTAGTAPLLNQTLADGTVGQEGPTYSPDGQFLWLGQQDEVTRFPVNPDGTLGTPTSFPLPRVGTHLSGNSRTPTPNSALVAQLAFSPDGSTLYAALNGQNTVVALDPNTGAVENTWNVGIAPRELTFVGNTLYVSDEGGRQAQPGDTTMDSYGTAVPSNGYLGTSATGEVSAIDTADPSAPVGQIAVGLHPTAMYASGSALFVANTNSDTVSVIDTTTNQVVQTIDTQPWPESSVGYEPDGIALTSDGHLLVTLGRANAVAVYRYDGTPKDPVNYIGLLPTDYYPADVATVGNQIVVTNTRGIDARGPALETYKGQGTVPVWGHDTHSTTASLTRFTLPSDSDIANYTVQVFQQNGWTRNSVLEADGRRAKPVPVPTRIGDPSVIKHVFLIIKENRTYDQLFGDIGKGNGDPSLTQFGEQATPNQHALAKQFGLYDNVYDVGTNSAEGHNWLMQGDNPEYSESSAGEYQRSYDTEEDVLGHQRSGFLWTAIESAGNTARNYGEFEYQEGKPSATWQQYYCATKSVMNGGDPAQLTATGLKGDYGSAIPSLNAIADPLSPPFDLSIPDIYRYEIWKQDFEQNGPANFNMIWLSSDHTGGPTDAEAGVADNDLATGQIVDTISHSKYWKDSAIFVVEDDSQDGANHVDGHRAPIQVISPWAQHGKVINTYYSQISIDRTIEQILGAQPLNEKVAAATPMYDAFTSKPDYAPFNAVPNQIPLTEDITTPPSCGLDTLGLTGAKAAALEKTEAARTAIPANMKAIAAAWTAWIANQHTMGDGAIPDYANPEQMNRFTWYQAHDWKVPYPGDKKIYLPSQIPGAYLPSWDDGS